MATPRRRRNWGALFVGFIIVVGIAAVGVAIFVVIEVTESVDTAINQSNELSNPDLSPDDLATLGLTGNEQFLFEGDAPRAVAAALDAGIPSDPTNFLELRIFPDYAFGTAQSSTQPDHFDSYGWRTGTVNAPTPEPNDAAAATMVFTIDPVNWAAIGALAADAVRLTNVEQGAVSHVTIDQNSFSSDRAIMVRIYVTGSRSNSFIESDANGTVIQIY